MAQIREIEHQGQPLYFIADDQGQPWLGGWRSKQVAEERYNQGEACDWDADQIDCSVDVEIEDALAEQD